VSLFNSRFRGLFIAIVVLALSASAVFAAKAVPQLASFVSSSVATTHTGTEADENEDGDAPDADDNEDSDSQDADKDEDAETDQDDATDKDADTDEASDNHGSIVSQAAHMATPDGFRNHGAFVSCVARMKDLGADGQPVDWSAITPEACAKTADEDATEAPNPDATEDEDAGTDADADEASDNHGAVVSQAAQMATPDGFRNHGAFVSCVAKMKDLGANGEAVDFTTVTPESCAGTTADEDTTSTDADSPTKGHGPKANHGHGHGHGKSKHHG
jgi:Sec-independent protein translocase protein TatA